MSTINTSKLFSSIKSFILTNKKIAIIVTIGILVVCFFIFRSSNTTIGHVETAARVNLYQSVRATGQVVSKTDLDLSFNKSGIVKAVKVAVGDTVAAGQILATLDQSEAFAKVTSAKGALLSAQARYTKTIQGTSSEAVALAMVILKNAQTDLANVKNTQSVLVANAYQNLLNSSIQAFTTSTSNTQTAPVLSGTYTGNKEGVIALSLYQSGNGSYFTTTGLVAASGIASALNPQPIGDSGLFITFPNASNDQNHWTIPIPNTQANDYLVNFNAYQTALKTQTNALSSAQALVDQKQAELDVQKAAARQPDIDIANADVISAQGALESAQAGYEDTMIRTPASGTVTRVDVKYGELADALKSVMTVEDVSNLYIEALINEANISLLKTGQNVDVTFDAFGKDKKFTGVVVQIDPSAQVNNGVVNYKIKVSLNEKDVTVRPGMNANINVLAGEKDQVVAVPSVAIIKKDGKSFVNIVKNDASDISEQREVTTGFVGDNNLVEVLSGLSENEKVVLNTN